MSSGPSLQTTRLPTPTPQTTGPSLSHNFNEIAQQAASLSRDMVQSLEPVARSVAQHVQHTDNLQKAGDDLRKAFTGAVAGVAKAARDVGMTFQSKDNDVLGAIVNSLKNSFSSGPNGTNGTSPHSSRSHDAMSLGPAATLAATRQLGFLPTSMSLPFFASGKVGQGLAVAAATAQVIKAMQPTPEEEKKKEEEEARKAKEKADLAKKEAEEQQRKAEEERLARRKAEQERMYAYATPDMLRRRDSKERHREDEPKNTNIKDYHYLA